MSKPKKEKIVSSLEIPMEVALNLPKIEIIGDRIVSVDNFMGIIDYENNFVRVNTKDKIVKISGDELEIDEITDDSIQVSGKIFRVEFLS